VQPSELRKGGDQVLQTSLTHGRLPEAITSDGVKRIAA
jgi:hypothetical protein